MFKSHLKYVFVLSILVFAVSAPSYAKKKPKLSFPIAATGAAKDSSDYAKATADFTAKAGMFKVLIDKTNKVLFEIPDSAFKHTYLLTNRIAGLSKTSDFVAGQMATSPMLITFTKDYNNVYMRLEQTRAVVSPEDPIKPSFDKNFVNPILKGFKITARTPNSVVIDVTSFFGGNEKSISPIRPDSPLAKLLGGPKNLKGTFVSDASTVTEVKSFPMNIEVKSMLSFTLADTNEPYTVNMHRSLVLLPDNPMSARLQDNRVGYFSRDKQLFSTKKDKVEDYAIISRWRLEPRDEDRDAYFAGKLVEPKKKIIFYVDSAFPEKWKGAVKEGIEYWKEAFEAAGFKNAIEARDYPKDDPNFDPDDARYSCVKYCATTIANSMGPSYVDPRTGEILVADVLWYHNITSLVHNWKFVQTGAVDPRVRKNIFDDSVMYEALTYVAAHEIGHTLGLMHNMGASYAFTIDNLRDPKFTQKYGTTPSIMDYARNNFVAQPGDYERGVRLTPPHLGVYDIHAIHWGYRIIPGVKTMLEEKDTLDKWIREKQGDPKFEFGAQQMMGTIDPTDQTEDLSNDHIKAGNMSISNLKIIMNNLEKWTMEKGENYDNVIEMYLAVVKQYQRHIGHVMPYIGGVIFKEVRQGFNDGNAKTYIDRVKTKASMDWLAYQVRNNGWLDKPNMTDKAEDAFQWKSKMEHNFVACLFNARTLQGIVDGSKADPAKCYSLYSYANDAFNTVFDATIKNKPLNDTERNMQNYALNLFEKFSGLKGGASSNSRSLADNSSVEAEYFKYLNDLNQADIPCNYSAGSDDTSFYRIVFGLPVLPEESLNPLMLSCMKKALSLYRVKRATTADKQTRDFYDYQITQIDNLLKNK